MIVHGFIHKIEQSINDIFVNIPQDLFDMISKYYFIPNDKEWTQAVKTDKNGKYVRDLYRDYFYLHSACALVNDDNDIFIFGGNDHKQTKSDNDHEKDEIIVTNEIFKLDTNKNVLTRLKDVKCPQDGLWYGVFCKKSKRVHLFERKMTVHKSIPLNVLNNASSVIVDC